MKKIFLLCILLLLVLLNPPITHAHTLGGPPFLKINGKYAQNNPYYQGTTTLNIPQDNPPESYLVNKPVLFEVDRDRLAQQTAIPSDFAKKLTFRWSYAEGPNFKKTGEGYQSGTSITYTFSKPQSYLVTLEAKSALDTDYIVIDIVQVNIVPTTAYRLPQVAAFVGTNNNDTQSPVLLVSQTTFDPTSGNFVTQWDFNDGKLYKGAAISRNFSMLNGYSIGIIYLSVVDEKGFVQDIGFNVENVKNKLHFAPFGNMTTIPVKFGAIEQAQTLTESTQPTHHKKNLISLYIFFGILGGIVILIFAVIVLKRRKNNS